MTATMQSATVQQNPQTETHAMNHTNPPSTPAPLEHQTGGVSSPVLCSGLSASEAMIGCCNGSCPHPSDCAVHNGEEAGPCDCGHDLKAAHRYVAYACRLARIRLGRLQRRFLSWLIPRFSRVSKNPIRDQA